MQFLRRYPECIDLSITMQLHHQLCVTGRLCRGFDPGGGMHPAVSGPGVSTSSPGRNASNLSTGAHILIEMGGSSRGSMRNLFIGYFKFRGYLNWKFRGTSIMTLRSKALNSPLRKRIKFVVRHLMRHL